MERQRLIPPTVEELFERSAYAFVDEETGDLSMMLDRASSRTAKIVFGIDESKKYYAWYVPGVEEKHRDTIDASPIQVAVLLMKAEINTPDYVHMNILRIFSQKLNEAANYLKA